MRRFISKVIRKIKKASFYFIKVPLTLHKTQKYNILNPIDTINYIIDNKCSLSRYGDGEFGIIWGYGNKFQKNSPKLCQKLSEVLKSNISNHKIGVPYYFKDPSSLGNPRDFWLRLIVSRYKYIKCSLNTNYQYLDASFTRFYFEKKDRSHSLEQLNLIKKIWDNKDIVIIEGTKTRSGVGNDLYDNAKSVQRILGPAENAFDSYDKMYNTILERVEKDQLILLCYGMTATVLAYDLAKMGYWAIDLGHVDIEYEWYLQQCDSNKIAIKGKYTNEVEGGDIVEECKDEKYMKEIICNITI